MKRLFCLILALVLLCGCKENLPDQTTGAAADPVPETTVQVIELEPLETIPITRPGGLGQESEGEILAFSNPGKQRLAYTGDVNYVKYITAFTDLPAAEGLEAYDDQFFADRALVVVVMTVGSGSVELNLDTITLGQGSITVAVKRTMPGEVGTQDMATWMLWAEVPQGLEGEWVLENASVLPGNLKS